MSSCHPRPGSSAGTLLLPALALVAVVVLAGGCSAPAAAEGPVATTTVDLPRSYRFAPPAITVPAGTTVTWTNNDTFSHNVRFEAEQPQTMRPGEQTTRTFDEPGLFPYLCTFHSQDLTGTVLVTE